MPPHDLTNVTEVLAQLVGITDAFSSIAAVPDRAEVADESGCLSVTLERGRIVDLRLASNWRDRIPPATLGDQLVVLTLKPMFDAFAAVRDAPEVPIPAETSRAMWDFGSDVNRDAIAAELLDARRTLDEMAASAAPSAVEPVTATSRNGRVTVSLIQGALSSIRYEESWLARAVAQAVCESTIEAVERAYELAEETRGDARARSTTSSVDAAVDAARDRIQRVEKETNSFYRIH